ncbi:hypothetical protein STEG23_024371 [Scotinomys teguina]
MSRRVEPVRPLSSSGVRTDMTAQNDQRQGPEEAQGQEDSHTSRKFRRWTWPHATMSEMTSRRVPFPSGLFLARSSKQPIDREKWEEK